MECFNIIAGTASIISLVLSIISLYKVNDVQNKLNNITKSKQSIEDTTLSNNSKIMQVGRDYSQSPKE